MSQGHAIVIKKNGGTEVLEHVKDFSFPAAGEGEVLIHSVSSSVNPVDIYIRNGIFGPLPDSQVVRTHFPQHFPEFMVQRSFNEQHDLSRSLVATWPEPL
jgi:hypothetical protein